jgi:chromate transporter
MVPWIKRSNLNYLIFGMCGIAGFALNTPLVFPLGVVLGGILSASFNMYDLPTIPKHPQKPIIWKNLIAVGGLFLFFGGIGLLLSRNQEFLNFAKPIILLENTYRIGALSFGGGNTMAAMSYEQYVQYNPRLTPQEFNTGLGLLQALPGPNFNFAIYLNTLAMKNYHFDFLGQLLGCIIGLIGIFLPGTLMVFFAYPIWNTLAHYRKIRLALDGIFAASVGFILTACLLINQHFIQHQIQQLSNPNWMSLTHVGIFFLSLIALYTKKIPTPFIVLFAILVGWLMPL